MFETEQRAPTRASIAMIRSALESAGVEFIPENGGGVGVRLRKLKGAITVPLKDLNAANDE
jgi:hypothetical protein